MAEKEVPLVIYVNGERRVIGRAWVDEDDGTVTASVDPGPSQLVRDIIYGPPSDYSIAPDQTEE